MRTQAQALREAIKSGAVEAWNRREKIQFRGDEGPFTDWSLREDYAPQFSEEELFWRPAPTKRRILFTLSTVPKHALWRLASADSPFYTVILYGMDGLLFHGAKIVAWSDLSESFEYSIDGGVTWETANQEVAP